MLGDGSGSRGFLANGWAGGLPTSDLMWEIIVLQWGLASLFQCRQLGACRNHLLMFGVPEEIWF